MYSTLRIGDLAEEVGVSVETLRAWERRYGFPVPERRPSGHRRYNHGHVEALRAAQRAQRDGVGIGEALRRARAQSDAERTSILATVRRARPDLAPITLGTRSMLAVSEAIEDDAATRVDRPLLVGAFQDTRGWARSRRRWSELAVTTEVTLALARGVPTGTHDRLTVASIPPHLTLTREWAVICEASDHSCCLVAAERPARDPQSPRRFEAMLTTDPPTVRAAMRTAIAVAVEAGAELAAWAERLDRPVERRSSDEAVATLLHRLVQYLDK